MYKHIGTCYIYQIHKFGIHGIRITYHWHAFVQPQLQSKSNEYYTTCVWICSLKYSACNAHASNCNLWPAPHYSIFPHYLINGKIFKKKKCYWPQNVRFDFLYNFCLEHFSFWEVNEIWQKWILVLPALFLSDFNETLHFSTDFRKILKYQISLKSFQWEPSCSMRTDTHD